MKLSAIPFLRLARLAASSLRMTGTAILILGFKYSLLCCSKISACYFTFLSHVYHTCTFDTSPIHTCTFFSCTCHTFANHNCTYKSCIFSAYIFPTRAVHICTFENCVLLGHIVTNTQRQIIGHICIRRRERLIQQIHDRVGICQIEKYRL